MSVIDGLMLFIFLVDGYWSEWGDWATCPVTCGGGVHARERFCTPPQYGGQECTGSNSEDSDCNTQECPG